MRTCFHLVGRIACLTLAILLACSFQASSADPFAEGVRTTDPRTPEAQRAGFKLPPGIEVDLIASEPNIAKPMNMAFDARGRLWVTTSYEYPFAKKPGEPARDFIRVFEDTDRDGSFEKSWIFADNLNIPIGILPYQNGCIVWSIPNIWMLRDTDGDGKADQREVLFGPLGWERDTHGNLSSFRMGADGWVYATHGFNNTSTVKARDGSSITMNSGNTFRFRPDGSRVEQFTWGQVNPFGMCIDDYGYLYTADCHSSPIYQLIPGGYYPSFGKPDDGLGFAPVMVQHSHGSTAISGIVILPSEDWPADLQGHLLIGNVMTSRLNRDRIDWTGSSPSGVEMPDFLSTDDPWFRPVDLQLGPDGALYVADFYNRIIGHYEVPLLHPGRDRERGRIWRIRPKSLAAAKPRAADFTSMDAQQLFLELGSVNALRRQHALNQLIDRIGIAASSLARQSLANPGAPINQRSGAIWVLARLGRFDAEAFRLASADPAPLVRVHALRAIGILRERPSAVKAQLGLALEDKNPHVRRAAAETMFFVHDATYPPLLGKALAAAPSADGHYRHSLRVALKSQLTVPGVLSTFTTRDDSEATWRVAADVACAVPTPESASFLIRHASRHSEPPANLLKIARHSARFASGIELESLSKLCREKLTANIPQQLELLLAMRKGAAERGEPLPESLRDWASDLLVSTFRAHSTALAGWSHSSIDPTARGGEVPWVFQERKTAEGGGVQMLSSLPPGGESFTGILKTPEFTLGRSLEFLMAGHDGFPDKAPRKENKVLLRDVVSGEALRETYSFRDDRALPVRWDLTGIEGRRVRVEVWDQNTEGAFAWIAIGGFSNAPVAWPTAAPRDLASTSSSTTELGELAKPEVIKPVLQDIVMSSASAPSAVFAGSRILSIPFRGQGMVALATLAGADVLPSEIALKTARAAAAGNAEAAIRETVEALRLAPQRVQAQIAQAMAGHPLLAGRLMDAFEATQAPVELLREGDLGDKLQAALPDRKARVQELRSKAGASDGKLQKLAQDRKTGYRASEADATRGAEVFTRHCGACHRVGTTGGLIGPQLDGIGNRGLERLCEDIVDPNRNVDHAFRTRLIILKDGETASGLPRREEGDALVMANALGQEFMVSKKDIAEQRESNNSLMPENFGELLTPGQFNDLLAFLLRPASSPGR